MTEKLKKLDFCTKAILPLVYDDSLSYYEAIAKLNSKLNEIINSINTGSEGQYILQPATETELGGVKAIPKTDETVEVAIDENGKLFTKGVAEIPIATSTTVGGVKPKTKTTESKEVAVDSEGKLFTDDISMATSTELGGIIADRKTSSDTTPVHIDEITGKLYVKPCSKLSAARTNTLGGIKADTKTDSDTVPVRIDTDTNKLFVSPSVEIAQADGNTIGGVKADERELADTVPVRIDGVTGKLYVAPSANVAQATATTIGGIKANPKTSADNTEVKIDNESGRLFVRTIADLEAATENRLGGIKAKAKTTENVEAAIGLDGKLYVPSATIPQATPTTIGGIKAKLRTTEQNEVAIDSSTGKLYSGGTQYVLPVASNTTLGGVKAKPKDQYDDREVAVDGTTGKLYVSSATPIADETTCGGFYVGDGGTTTGNPSPTPAFYPLGVSYPFLYGVKTPYSVNGATGVMDVFNTQMVIDFRNQLVLSVEFLLALSTAKQYTNDIIILAKYNNKDYVFRNANGFSDEDPTGVWVTPTANDGSNNSYLQLNINLTQSPIYTIQRIVISGGAGGEIPPATWETIGGVIYDNDFGSYRYLYPNNYQYYFKPSNYNIAENNGMLTIYGDTLYLDYTAGDEIDTDTLYSSFDYAKDNNMKFVINFTTGADTTFECMCTNDAGASYHFISHPFYTTQSGQPVLRVYDVYFSRTKPLTETVRATWKYYTFSGTFSS